MTTTPPIASPTAISPPTNVWLRTRFGALTDAEWIALLATPAADRSPDLPPLPQQPPVAVQVRIHGTSGPPALIEASHFLGAVRNQAAACGNPLGEASRILDFGCGYGRMLSLLTRTVPGEHLHGADVDAALLAVGRDANPFVTFTQVQSAPPSPFADGQFDLIYAYSVFSHLSEAASLAWITEFSRILAPGGVVVVTTQGRDFINRCDELRRGSLRLRLLNLARKLTGRTRNPAWEQSLARCFPDPGDALSRFDRGQFLFAPTGGGDVLESTYYGEAVIPPDYAREVWGKLIPFVSYQPGSRRLPQPIIVLRKPPAPE